jgi:hypothetical protein
MKICSIKIHASIHSAIYLVLTVCQHWTRSWDVIMAKSRLGLWSLGAASLRGREEKGADQ